MKVTMDQNFVKELTFINLSLIQIKKKKLNKNFSFLKKNLFLKSYCVINFYFRLKYSLID